MSWRDSIAFELSEGETFAYETSSKFAREVVAPLAAKIDQEHYFPKELIPQMADLGLMGAVVPEEYGGSGLSYVAYVLIIEELSAACASTGIIVSAHTSLCTAPVLEYGTEDQKKEFLPLLAGGKKLGCFALSEPGTGSDAAALTCTARKEGDHYIINGTKNWITNGPEAGICVLFATQDPSKGHKGVTAFVHHMDLPGISIGKKEHKLGIRGSPTSSIIYDNVKLPASALLGQELKGFNVAMWTLNGGRIGVAAQAVGIARAAFDDALQKIWKELDALNEAIDKNEPWKLAKTDLQATQKLLYEWIGDILKLSAALAPFLPSTAEKIHNIFTDGRVDMHVGMLFPRIEKED